MHRLRMPLGPQMLSAPVIKNTTQSCSVEAFYAKTSQKTSSFAVCHYEATQCVSNNLEPDEFSSPEGECQSQILKHILQALDHTQKCSF